MSADALWTAVRNCTADIVTNPSFQRIARCVPYFEGWWTPEVAQRFGQSIPTSAYRLAGFDPMAVSRANPKWQPDMLLDAVEGDMVREIAWVELKLLNLERRLDPTDATLTTLFRKKVGLQLTRMCKELCNVFGYARSVDLAKTADFSFQQSTHLQNVTLEPAYRRSPKAVFRSAHHLAAAFMLAIVPEAWGEKFATTLDRTLNPTLRAGTCLFRNEVLAEWNNPSGGSTVVRLCGLIGNVLESQDTPSYPTK